MQFCMFKIDITVWRKIIAKFHCPYISVWSIAVHSNAFNLAGVAEVRFKFILIFVAIS